MSNGESIFTNPTMHLVPYPTKHHSEQKCAHFCFEWCIVGYGTGALCHLWDWSISSISSNIVTPHGRTISRLSETCQSSVHNQWKSRRTSKKYWRTNKSLLCNNIWNSEKLSKMHLGTSKALKVFRVSELWNINSSNVIYLQYFHGHNLCNFVLYWTVLYPIFDLICNRHVTPPVLWNSMTPNDTTQPTLVLVMACCLTAPSHYLKQGWLITDEVLWHSDHNTFIGSAPNIEHYDLFENHILKII